MSMSRTFFKEGDDEQALELTVRPGDGLPPDHLARFVEDSVAWLHLSAGNPWNGCWLPLLPLPALRTPGNGPADTSGVGWRRTSTTRVSRGLFIASFVFLLR